MGVNAMASRAQTDNRMSLPTAVLFCLETSLGDLPFLHYCAEIPHSLDGGVEQRRYKIAVLGGTGAQGSGLALRLAAAGHALAIGSRDGERAIRAAAELSARTAKPITGCDNRAAAAAAETVIL